MCSFAKQKNYPRFVHFVKLDILAENVHCFAAAHDTLGPLTDGLIFPFILC